MYSASGRSAIALMTSSLKRGVSPFVEFMSLLAPRTCASTPAKASSDTWSKIERRLSASTNDPETNATPRTTEIRVRMRRPRFARAPRRASLIIGFSCRSISLCRECGQRLVAPCRERFRRHSKTALDLRWMQHSHRGSPSRWFVQIRQLLGA